MPRFNNEGRTNNFIHMRGGNRNNDDRGKYKFIQGKGGIRRKNKDFVKFDAGGDTVMDAAEPGSSRGHVQFQRGNKKRNKQWRNIDNNDRGQPKKDNHVFGSAWHRITIINGTAYEKSFMLPALGQLCRVPFLPICYSNLGSNAVFYVEERAPAEALAECSGKVTSAEGQKIYVRVHSCGTPPTAHIDEMCEAKMKAVLERRFNSALQTLNLESFHMSPELVNDYFLPLYRPSVVKKLTELLQPHLGTIVGLDLAENRLPTLDGLCQIVNKSTSLKALNLRGNRLREFSQLDRISGPSIVELILEGNPICDNAQDKEIYISSVRKRFPKVVKLDGSDLAPPLSFEVNEPSKMPEVRGSSFCNEQAKVVVLRFWELFVSIYDSEDRQPLLDAYHDMASMSMMAAYAQPGHVSQIDPSKKLSVYLNDSRNLIRQTDKQKRFKLLHQGKLDIVSFLAKLPKSTHDHNSYLIDMPVAMENFVMFTVTGLFKERTERNNPIRYFCRTFTLVPQNAGFVIINEMLFVTNPTTDQVKEAFKLPAPTPSPSPALPPPVVPAAVPTPTTDEERRQMLILFAQQSGMNEAFSRKCLEENAWDFNKSAYIFTQLKEQNKIPPEAYVK